MVFNRYGGSGSGHMASLGEQGGVRLVGEAFSTESGYLMPSRIAAPVNTCHPWLADSPLNESNER